MALLDTDGGNHRCPHCGAIECDIHLDQREVMTHSDCGENWRGGCSGMMCFWENPNTGNRRWLCAEHADEAERRQAQIHREYLNDTTLHMSDY